MRAGLKFCVFSMVFLVMFASVLPVPAEPPRERGTILEKGSAEPLKSLVELIPSASLSPCETALEAAAARHEIPPGLLVAIARARQDRAQATRLVINVDGWRKVFDTTEAAERGLVRLRTLGDMRIGCGLLSERGSRSVFEEPEAMFDNRRSAEVLTAFLAGQYRVFKSWDLTIEETHTATVWRKGRVWSFSCTVFRHYAALRGVEQNTCQ